MSVIKMKCAGCDKDIEKTQKEIAENHIYCDRCVKDMGESLVDIHD